MTTETAITTQKTINRNKDAKKKVCNVRAGVIPWHNTYSLAVQCNLWGTGNLEGALRMDGAEYEFKFPVGGELKPMSSLFLKAYQMGEERAIQYYDNWHICMRNTVSRPGVDAQLKLIPAQASVRQEQVEQLRIIKLSTEKHELMKLPDMVFTKKAMLEELDHLRAHGYSEIPEISSQKKEKVIEVLCDWRKIYFDDYPEELERHQYLSENFESSDRQTTRAQRKQDLGHFLYSLRRSNL